MSATANKKKAGASETNAGKLFALIGEEVILWTTEGSALRGVLTEIATQRISIGSMEVGDNEEKDFYEVPIRFILDDDTWNFISLASLVKIERGK